MRWRSIATGLVLAAAGSLGGCVAPSAVRPIAAPAPPPTYSPVGLERVLGQNAAGLVSLFGPADADVREGTGRKLQFAGSFCVLDAYLYPKGQDEAKVTYLDAREPDGSAIDRASCVAALTRRDGGK
jgi:hypothetical protein